MVKQVKIYDQNIKYEIIHRNIKYPRLEFRTGKLQLILPEDNRNPKDLIEKHKDWIYNKITLIQDSIKNSKNKNLDFQRTDENFKILVKNYVNKTSKNYRLKINNIYFRRMKSKWGSCSKNKNLTINSLLKYLPDNLIRYVIFHEMIHLIERKHNEQYWKIISKKFPNYHEMEKDLLIYWFLIQKVIKSDQNID
jgi:predicted metal-dependent hydrolase